MKERFRDFNSQSCFKEGEANQIGPGPHNFTMLLPVPGNQRGGCAAGGGGGGGVEGGQEPARSPRWDCQPVLQKAVVRSEQDCALRLCKCL